MGAFIVWWHPHRKATTQEIDALRAVLRPFAHDGISTIRRDGLTILTAGEEPVISPDGRIAVGTVRLDTPTELWTVLATATGPRTPLHAVLAAEARWGRDAGNHLSGDVAAVVMDPSAGTVLAFRDHLGGVPLHWSRNGHDVVIASTPALVAGVPGHGESIDLVGLADHASSEHPDDTRTSLEGVNRIPPATAITSHHGSTSSHRFWEPRLSRKLRIAEAADLDHLRGLVVSAVASRLPVEGTIGIELSGGLDSSMIAAVAVELAGPSQVIAYTRSDGSEVDESAIAARTAAHLGIRHRIIPYPPTVDESKRTALHAAVGVPLTIWPLTGETELYAAARDDGIVVMLNGHGGDELFEYDLVHHARMMQQAPLRSAYRWARGVRAERGAIRAMRAAGFRGWIDRQWKTQWWHGLASRTHEQRWVLDALEHVGSASPLTDLRLVQAMSRVAMPRDTSVHEHRGAQRQLAADWLTDEVHARSGKSLTPGFTDLVIGAEPPDVRTLPHLAKLLPGLEFPTLNEGTTDLRVRTRRLNVLSTEHWVSYRIRATS